MFRPSRTVSPKRRQIGQIKLGPYHPDDSIGNGIEFRRKNTRKAGCSELKGKSKPIVAAAQSADGLAVRRVEVEISGKLIAGRRLGVTSVSRTLCVAEKPCRHGVRNSQVLRHIPAALKTKGKSVAQHLCGTESFCNMIRTPLEAAA